MAKEPDQIIQARQPKGSLGQLKMQSYKMPVPLIEKINRIAYRKRITRAQVVRCAVEQIEEEAG